MADRNSKQKCYIYLKIPNLGSRENVVQQFLWGVSYWDRYYMKYCMYSQIQNLRCEIWSSTKHQVNSVRSYILLHRFYSIIRQRQHSYCHSPYLSCVYGKKDSCNFLTFSLACFGGAIAWIIWFYEWPGQFIQ